MRANASTSLVFVSVYDAPASLIYDAWTDPEHLARWWGPKGFTTTTNEMRVQVGGIWDYIMYAPDGCAYPSKAVYTVTNRPTQLCFSNTGGDAVQQHLTCDFMVNFEETNNRTHLTLEMQFNSQQALDLARKFGAELGGRETLRRLGRVIQDDAIRSNETSRNDQ